MAEETQLCLCWPESQISVVTHEPVHCHDRSTRSCFSTTVVFLSWQKEIWKLLIQFALHTHVCASTQNVSRIPSCKLTAELCCIMYVIRLCFLVSYLFPSLNTLASLLRIPLPLELCRRKSSSPTGPVCTGFTFCLHFVPISLNSAFAAFVQDFWSWDFSLLFTMADLSTVLCLWEGPTFLTVPTVPTYHFIGPDCAPFRTFSLIFQGHFLRVPSCNKSVSLVCVL
jgi:hypothetical protein